MLLEQFNGVGGQLLLLGNIPPENQLKRYGWTDVLTEIGTEAKPLESSVTRPL